MPEMRQLCLAASLVGCVAIGLAMSGCGSEPEAPVAAAPTYTPPPPAPPAPRVTSISDLMAELRIDERIMFDESAAPDNNPARIAILEFFDGFARGDNQAVSRLLDPLDRRELNAMVESRQWHDSVEGIEAIWIYETGTAGGSVSSDDRQRAMKELVSMGARLAEQPEKARELLKEAFAMSDEDLERLIGSFGTPEWEGQMEQMTQAAGAMPAVGSSLYDGEKCVLAIFTIDGREQAQLWYYRPNGEQFTFMAAPTPPNIIAHLHGESWIKAWHDIIEREIMLASKPDDNLRAPQQRLEEEETGSSGGGSSPGGPTRPSGVPLSPGDDAPPVLPQEAPGF